MQRGRGPLLTPAPGQPSPPRPAPAPARQRPPTAGAGPCRSGGQRAPRPGGRASPAGRSRPRRPRRARLTTRSWANRSGAKLVLEDGVLPRVAHRPAFALRITAVAWLGVPAVLVQPFHTQA